jgi:hypothetical protein
VKQVRVRSYFTHQIYKNTEDNGEDPGFNGDGWYLDDDFPLKASVKIVHNASAAGEVVNGAMDTLISENTEIAMPNVSVFYIENIGKHPVALAVDGEEFNMSINPGEAWGGRLSDDADLRYKASYGDTYVNTVYTTVP